MKRKSTGTALDAYVRKTAAIDALIRRLQGACDEHFFNGPEGVQWGHVGDLTAIEEGLQHICDQVFREGEYAPENKA